MRTTCLASRYPAELVLSIDYAETVPYIASGIGGLTRMLHTASSSDGWGGSVVSSA